MIPFVFCFDMHISKTHSCFPLNQLSLTFKEGSFNINIYLKLMTNPFRNIQVSFHRSKFLSEFDNKPLEDYFL